jgi:hypothetical protein
MDHHDDWGHWHEDESGFGDADTADLGGGEHLGDLGGHDDTYSGHEGHESYDGYDEGTDLSSHDAGPDLVHEDVDDPGGHEDFGRQDAGHQDFTGPDEPVTHLVGVDPDVPPGPDAAWHDADFPPPLDLDVRPEPSDGYPWADPDTLGDPDAGYDLPTDTHGAPPAGDLFAYAGLDAPAPGVDPWGPLLVSDDPATGALARFWGPNG